MLLLSIDFETTGLDPEKDRITEVGAVLWSTGYKRAMETASFFVNTGVPVSKEITEITGITDKMLMKFGVEESWMVDEIRRMSSLADAFIGQNCREFDRYFLLAAAKRVGIEIPDKLWIDTRTDLPATVESKRLTYMAADHGFLNPFPHNAVTDAFTVLRIAACYDESVMVERAKSPVVVLQSLQPFEQNDAAKKLKFMFKPDLGKRWLRVVKQCDLAQLEKDAPFDMCVVTDITPNQVWH